MEISDVNSVENGAVERKKYDFFEQKVVRHKFIRQVFTYVWFERLIATIAIHLYEKSLKVKSLIPSEFKQFNFFSHESVTIGLYIFWTFGPILIAFCSKPFKFPDKYMDACGIYVVLILTRIKLFGPYLNNNQREFAFFPTDVDLIAISILIILTFQSKFELTWKKMITLMVILSSFTFVYVLIVIDPSLRVDGLAVTGVLLLIQIFMIIDVCIIMKDKHKHRFRPQDAVSAFVCFYHDHVHLIVFLLKKVFSKKN